MSAIEDAVAALRQAVQDAAGRFQTGDVEAAVAAERAKYDELVSAENAEDVQQNQELADARAATDAAVAQLNSAVGALSGLTDQVNQLGRTASEATSEVTNSPTNPPVADETAPPADTSAPAETSVDQPGPADQSTSADNSTPGDQAPSVDTTPAAPVDNAPPPTGDSTDVTNMRPNL